VSFREQLTAAGVHLGALLLVGPVVYVVVALAVDAGLSVAGVHVGPLRLAAVVVPLALALYAASAVAAVSLEGPAALWRGTSHEVVLRHVVLSLLALVGLAEVGWTGLGALSWSLAEPGAHLMGAAAALVVVAVWGALVLFGLGVREGYRVAS